MTKAQFIAHFSILYLLLSTSYLLPSIPLPRPCSTLLLIDYGGIIFSFQIQSMDIFRINIFQFWKVFFDKFCLRIKLLWLQKWVKYPDRFRICTDWCAPLPITIVHCLVIVDEIFFEPFFSESPVYPEILREKWCHHHTETIVHPARLDELPDSCIDERVSGFSLLKHLPLIARLILIPLDRSPPFLEFDLIGEWEIIHDVVPELSPDEFIEEGFRWNLHFVMLRYEASMYLLSWILRFTQDDRHKLPIYLSHRIYPKPYIRRESCRSIDSWEIAQIIIARKVSLHAFSPECECPVLMMWHSDNLTDFLSIDWDVPSHLRTIKHSNTQPFWMGEDEFFPQHRERREYLALLDLMWFDEEKVLIRMISYSLFSTYVLYEGIPFFSRWGVCRIHIHCIYLMLSDNLSDNRYWISWIYGYPSSYSPEYIIHRFEHLSDKAEPHIISSKILYRTNIMDKNRKYFLWLRYGFEERCIVLESEILTEDI